MHDTSLNLRALMYAECCFETFRCMNREVFALEQHMQRLTLGLASFGLNLPSALFSEAIDKAAQTAQDCLVRITVGGAQAPWGLSQVSDSQPAYWIQSMPMSTQVKDIHLQQVTWPFPLQARPAKYTADYATTLRALQQLALPPNIQPLICDQHMVYSASTANVLLFVHDHWLTPASNFILKGVVRAFLLAQGVVVAESCPLDMLQDVKAIALSNSGCFITPVKTLNGRELCTTGEIFDQLWQPLLSQRGVIRTC